MKTSFIMIAFSLCLMSSFVKANSDMGRSCASTDSMTQEDRDMELADALGKVIASYYVPRYEYDKNGKVVAVIKDNHLMFECNLVLHEDGKIIAKKMVDICSNCQGSGPLAILLDEVLRGDHKKFLSAFESKKLVVYGRMNGMEKKAELGVYRHHGLKKKFSSEILEKEQYILKPIEISNERTESASFENYDLDISCKELRKTIRNPIVQGLEIF